MSEPSIKPIKLASLDDMIDRAEAACERGRKRLEARRVPPSRSSKTSQLKMEETLARLRAQREEVAP